MKRKRIWPLVLLLALVAAGCYLRFRSSSDYEFRWKGRTNSPPDKAQRP